MNPNVLDMHGRRVDTPAPAMAPDEREIMRLNKQILGWSREFDRMKAIAEEAQAHCATLIGVENARTDQYAMERGARMAAEMALADLRAGIPVVKCKRKRFWIF